MEAGGYYLPPNECTHLTPSYQKQKYRGRKKMEKMEKANVLPEVNEKIDGRMMHTLPEYSENKSVVLSQLMKAKAEMGSVVKKDAANPFHKSRYASLGAHLELSESILLKHGLLMLHSPNFLNNKPILVATLYHQESDQWIKAYLPLPNPKADSQGIGASLTYMRRYSINSILGLNAEDDDGETASGRGKYNHNAPKNTNISEITVNSSENAVGIGRVSKTEIIALGSLLAKLDKETEKSFLEWIKKNYNAQALHEIPKECFQKCMVSLNSKIKYLADKEMVVA